MSQRSYSSPYLCDLDLDRIGVQCDLCGLTRRYDRLALMGRLEHFDDQCLPNLLRKLARSEGCQRALKASFGDPCRLVYDAASRLS